MHALFHYSLPIMPLNSLVRLCLTCGELDLFLFKKKKRQKCKGQCISLFLSLFFFFYCCGIFLLFLQEGMACCPYERLLQGWHWQCGSFKHFSKFLQFPCQNIMCHLLAITAYLYEYFFTLLSQFHLIV